jgi:hypothetical protein
MASRTKQKRGRRGVAAPKSKPAGGAAEPDLTPEQLEAQDAFFELIDEQQQRHWKMGDLLNQWSAKWKRTGRYRGFTAFYKKEIFAKRKNLAPAYSTLTTYARVAAAWSEENTAKLGMTTLSLVWAWLTFKQLPFPADPSNVMIPVPGPTDDSPPTWTPVAQANDADIRRALKAAKTPPTKPPTKRESWLIRRIELGLEDYQPGGSVLLHAASAEGGFVLSLHPSPSAHFIELIDCIEEAIHKDIPGDDEPNGP